MDYIIDGSLLSINTKFSQSDCVNEPWKGRGATAVLPHPSHLLEIPLHDEVLYISAADHEPLPLPKIDRPQLGLYHAAVAYDAHERVEVARWVRDGCRDVELGRKVAAEVHDGRIVLAQKVDFVRRQARAQVAVCEQRGQRGAERPVHVLQAVEPVRVVREQTSLVAQDGGLVEQERGRISRECGDVGLRGDGVVDELLEVALLAYDCAHEAVVVLEEGVRERRPARFLY